jgi:hypothetical protein
MVPAAKSDVYVAMLGVALGAILIGCLMLVLVLNRYEFKTKVSARFDSPAPVALAAVEKIPANPVTVRL